MEKKMKIGIVGFGYWGQIIAKTLQQLGYSDFVICEPEPVDWGRVGLGSKYEVEVSYKNIDCDKIFIATPATTHYKIVKYFLENGIDVFCEKPLDLIEKNCVSLYDIAEKNEAKLFVDWVFTFNPQLAQIKKLINDTSYNSMGSLQNIFMNRLNFGPVRDDVNARWDLASHDVSILLWLLESFPDTCLWTDYNNLGGSTDDSVLGLLNFSGVNAVINASWAFPKKDRMCHFVFEKGLVSWDDVSKQICIGQLVSQSNHSGIPPLVSSIGSFLNDMNFDYGFQKKLTLDVTRIMRNIRNG
jgi:UDP-2-acetamido-3-amino-2,3-dideoxy-glucuronate N-acetyltransferase